MTTIRMVTGSAAILMLGAIAYGLLAGDFGDDGGLILDLVWGRVTLVDLYLGLVLFGGWIVIRERSAVAVPWLVALVVLGNLAAAVYAFVAAMRTDSITVFLMGESVAD